MSYQWVRMLHVPGQLVPQGLNPPPRQGPPSETFYPVQYYPPLPLMQTLGLPYGSGIPATPLMGPPQHFNPNFQYSRQPFQPIFAQQRPVYPPPPPAHFLPQTRPWHSEPVRQPPSGPSLARIPLENTHDQPIAVQTESEIERAKVIMAEYDLLPFWLKLGPSSSSSTAADSQTWNIADPAAPPEAVTLEFFPGSSTEIDVGRNFPAVTVQLVPRVDTNISEAENQEVTKSSRKPFCRFCKNNGESERFYESHALKTDTGKTACPVLRKLKCPLCGKQGDEAHTLKHCDLYVPPPGQAQKFGRNANGRIRKIMY